MNNFNSDSLKIQCKEVDSTIYISWIGESDERDIDQKLTPYFNQLIEKLDGEKFVITFDELYYMNSSTVPPIIKLMKDLNNKKIPTTLIYNKDSKWQKASFKALETLSTLLEFISVQSV
jgi:hypothetical protein